MADVHWRDQAACIDADPDLFFPGRDPNDWRIPEAKEVCARCPVTRQCEQAGADFPFGIWGGRTPRERGFKEVAR